MHIVDPFSEIENIFELRGVEHRYGRMKALSIDTLSIRKGTITGIVGPNGSGKSTLLKILSFIMKPSSGEVLFNGRSEVPFSPEVRFNVSLLTQEPYLLRRSVYENIRYGLRIRHTHGITGNRDKQIAMKVRMAMINVGLDFKTFSERRWDQLSGGEAQRVAMAARLALGPQALLLDEPTASVDLESADRIRDAARRARDELGSTIVVASHDTRWLERLCDTHIVLEQGRLVH